MKPHLLAAVALIATLALSLLALAVLEPAAQQTPDDWQIRLDYRTSPFDPDNSALQYRNSPLDWQNSPINPASPQLRDPATGQPHGYIVPRPDGGINVFAPDGQWLGVQRGPR